MSKLKDMEELIEGIVDINMKEYMREALTCYMTDAYRACIVLSFIAIFEDVFKKLDGMATTNSTARTIFNEIKQKRDEQKVFENDLLNKLKSAKIISEIDADFLGVLKTLRNKAAHPSGHKPTAEEARYVYSETINRFLSKPVLSTTQVADEIISKLTNEYLFPTTDIRDYSNIVNQDIKTLHSDGYAYLIKKLMNSLGGGVSQIPKNAKNYILGLAHSPINEVVVEQIRKGVLTEYSSDENKRILLIESISTNSKLLQGLDNTVYLRLNKMILDTIKITTTADQHTFLRHPVNILNSLIKLDRSFIDQHFPTVIDEVISKYMLSPLLMKYVQKQDWVKQKVITSIFQQAGSSTFDEANSFAKSAWSSDVELTSLMDAYQCFELLVRISDAALGGAYTSNDVLKSKFANIPKVKMMAENAIADNPARCQEIIDSIRPGLGSLTEFSDNHF